MPRNGLTRTRAVMHGFVAQEEGGFFAHFPVDAEVSFQLAVQCCVQGIARAEQEKADE